MGELVALEEARQILEEAGAICPQGHYVADSGSHYDHCVDLQSVMSRPHLSEPFAVQIALALAESDCNLVLCRDGDYLAYLVALELYKLREVDGKFHSFEYIAGDPSRAKRSIEGHRALMFLPCYVDLITSLTLRQIRDDIQTVGRFSLLCSGGSDTNDEPLYYCVDSSGWQVFPNDERFGLHCDLCHAGVPLDLNHGFSEMFLVNNPQYSVCPDCSGLAHTDKFPNNDIYICPQCGWCGPS